MWTLTVVNLYTFVVYLTASVITPTAGAIMERYNISLVVASLGLSMYVVGCELIPLLFPDVLILTFRRRSGPYVSITYKRDPRHR